MPAWRPISRRALVATLRRLGFAGPYSGGKLTVLFCDLVGSTPLSQQLDAEEAALLSRQTAVRVRPA